MTHTLRRSTAPPNGFRLTGRTELFTGPFFSIRRLSLDLPDGTSSDFDVAQHPGSVAVVAVDESNRVLLVHQWRPAVQAGEWELPAGIRDEAGEPAQEAAERELREEAGVAAGTWERLVVVHTSPGFTDERCEIFLARHARQVAAPDREPAESGMRSRWVALDEAVGAVLAGDITNGPSVAGLLAMHARTPL